MKIKFRSNIAEKEEQLFFKNYYKLGCLIPEIPKLSQGTHEINIDVSINGVQFFPTGKKIMYTGIIKLIQRLISG